MAPDNQLEQFSRQLDELDRIPDPTRKLSLLMQAMTTVEGIKDPNQQLAFLKRMKTSLDLLLPKLRGNEIKSGGNLNDAVTQRLEKLQKLNASAGVKSGFPVDFSLYDENLHYVLYITDDPSKDQKLKVELKNTSGQEIDLSALDKPEMADKSNFELRFRKGVLSDLTLGILRKSTPELSKLSILSDEDLKKWNVSLSETIANDKHAISLSFRNKQSTPIPLLPDSALTLNLQNISADAGSGARGTRVEFIPHEMIFNSGKNTLVTGNREQHLFITNHSGQKQIPLHVGFVGSNKILNDGRVHNDLPLTLRIQNIAKPGKPGQETSITLKAGQNAPSKFTISFDVQEGEDKSKPWALCKATELDTVVEAGTNKKFQLGKQTTIKGLVYDQNSQQWKPTTDASLVKVGDLTAGLAQSRELTVTFQYDIKLDSGSYIEIVLSGFQSSLPSGLAHMYVNYNNIPGYWDGHFILTVEKTPLLFRDNNNVGIGTAQPSASLQVGDPSDASYFSNVVALGIVQGTKAIGLSIRAKDTNPQMQFGADNTFNYIQMDKTSGEFLIGRSKFSSGLSVDGVTTLNGNVGIGTSTPKTKLDVAGTVTATKFAGEGAFVTGMIIMWSGSVDNIPVGWALCNGQNNTPDLRGKFILGGNGQDTGSTGGTTNHTHRHNHTYTNPKISTSQEGNHNHGISTGQGGNWSLNPHAGSTSMDYAALHSHSLSLPDTNQNNEGNVDHRPPYYTLCFIVKL